MSFGATKRRCFLCNGSVIQACQGPWMMKYYPEHCDEGLWYACQKCLSKIRQEVDVYEREYNPNYPNIWSKEERDRILTEIKAHVARLDVLYPIEKFVPREITAEEEAILCLKD